MNVFERSWAVTKQAFHVMKEDKEIFMFPILSSIFSFVLLVLFILPFILGAFAQQAFASTGAVFNYALMFVYYLLVVMIATFFNVATTYTAKKRFSGGNATFGESISFAFSRMKYIFQWSIVAAIVGLILKALENAGNRKKGVAAIGIAIARSILGAAWAIATIFVIPVIAFENVGPFAAIKRSWGMFKQTWGENAVLYFGTGLIQGLFVVPIFVIMIVLVVVGVIVQSIGLIITAIILGVLLISVVSLFFTVANTVFKTALYIYASSGKVPSSFSPEIIKSAAKKIDSNF